MSCVLSIIGENFDVDAFVNESKIRGFNVGYKGDPINKVNKRTRTFSLASITTSNADFDNIKDQIEETIEFLVKYKSSLIHIANTPGIECATIDFGVESIIDKNHLTQSFNFPIELIKVCADLGIEIELSIYKPDMQTILEKG